MSEMGFMLFQHIALGAETVLCAFCMAAFFRPYMAGRKNRLQKTIAVFLVYGTVYLAGKVLAVSGWLCMVIVILLLMAGSRWLCMERKQVFLYGILFFCTRNMGRLITESLYYLFNGKIVQGLDNENMIYHNVAAGYSAFMILRIILLSQMPDCINKICENSAKNGARLVSLEISIDSEDCITTKCVGVFEADPGTEESKKMVEEARARNKERKEEWEKLLEKNKEKKVELEKLEEKKDGRQYDITVMGTDMGKITENLISKIGMGNSAMSTAPTVTGFDLKV